MGKVMEWANNNRALIFVVILALGVLIYTEVRIDGEMERVNGECLQALGDCMNRSAHCSDNLGLEFVGGLEWKSTSE